MKEKLLKQSIDLIGRLEEHESFLYSHAEIEFEVKETSNYIMNELQKIGIQSQKCGKEGIVAIIEGNSRGKTFLLRADMDALKGIDVDAPDSNMHACGHHMHSSMLLGAAEILFNNRHLFKGCVKLMFQPAEEILSGALDMIESGVLESPHVDAGMMLHVVTGIDSPMGSIIVSSEGVSAPSADFFKIIIKGKGTHGAMAHLGIDPISISAYIICALHEINAREIPVGEPCALTMGSINGGTNANAIPDVVEVQGSLRAFEEKDRELIKRRLVEISENIATAFRGHSNVLFTRGCPSLINDGELSSMAFNLLSTALGTDMVSMSESNSKISIRGGSEDFAYVSQKIPTVSISICAGSVSDGYVYPLHNPKVRFDKRALPIGAFVYSAIAIAFLNNKTADE